VSRAVLWLGRSCRSLLPSRPSSFQIRLQSWVRSPKPEARGPPSEAPVAFYWKDFWWLITDAHGVPGLAVHRSAKVNSKCFVSK